MSRYNYQSYAKDGNGSVINSATVSVRLSETSTIASVYTASAGGTAVNSVTSESDGYFSFWVDDGDYTGEQLFRLVFNKSGFGSATQDNISILPPLYAGSGTTANRPVVSTVGMYYVDTDIPATIYWNGSDWTTNSLVSDNNPTLAATLDADSNDIDNLNDIITMRDITTSRNITFTGTLNTDISTTEVSYLNGVTSNIQTQINSLPTKLVGIYTRPKFKWQAVNQISIDFGLYHHDGTTEQLLYWSDRLTYTFTSLAASDWSYLYFDDSAIVTATTNLITVTELTDLLTEPTRDNVKHGWYNGSDKCFFAVPTDGGGNILEFWHDGGNFVQYGSAVTDLSDVDIDESWTNVTLTAPSFATSVFCVVEAELAGGVTSSLYIRPEGGAGSGTEVARVNSDVTRGFLGLPVATDASETVEMKYSAAGSNTASVATHGWYFPFGM